MNQSCELVVLEDGIERLKDFTDLVCGILNVESSEDMFFKRMNSTRIKKCECKKEK